MPLYISFNMKLKPQSFQKIKQQKNVNCGNNVFNFWDICVTYSFI